MNLGSVSSLEDDLSSLVEKGGLDSLHRILTKPYLNNHQRGLIWDKITLFWLQQNGFPEFLQNLRDPGDLKLIKERLQKQRKDLKTKYTAIKAWKDQTGNTEPPFPEADIEECWDDLVDHFEFLVRKATTVPSNHEDASGSGMTSDKVNENGKRASTATTISETIHRSRKKFPRSTPASYIC